jgi:hypothetical protein
MKTNLKITGKLIVAPSDPVRPLAKYVFQGCAPGTGNITSDLTRSTMVRTHVIPSDPQTPAQLAQRARISAAVSAWHALPQPDKDALQAPASKLGLAAYHLFIRNFLRDNPPP